MKTFPAFLVAAFVLAGAPTAEAQTVRSKSWVPAVYHGLVVGKSTRNNVLRILGKPKSTGRAAESDPPMLYYDYDVADPVKGRIEVYFRGAIVDSMALYPDASLTQEDVIRILGERYSLVRYAGDDCLGSGGAGPMYEDPEGDIKHMEYRNRGLAVAFNSSKVEAILYVQRAFGPTHPRCAHEGMKGSDYFPLSVGNQWNYALDEHSKMGGNTITWRVTQKEIVHGSPVYHLWPTPAQGDEPLSLSAVQDGVLEWGSERIILKKPLRAKDRWTVKSDTARGKGKLDAFEVVSAGEECTVGGESFEDCASVREDDEANNVTSLTTYARRVGPVKYVYFKAIRSKEVDTVLTIKSWEVH